MANPYIDAIIEVNVAIRPHQMNNNILEHVKDNINQIYLGKCYKNFGFISKIYKIEDFPEDPPIRADDVTCSALCGIKFSCKLCNPLIDTTYVAKVTGRNMMVIIGEYGPIRFIISKDYINRDKIAYVQNKAAFFPKNANGEIINSPIEIGTYIIAKPMSKKIVNNGKRIDTISTMEAVATDDEIKRSIKYEFEQQDIIHISSTDSETEKQDHFEQFKNKTETTAEEEEEPEEETEETEAYSSDSEESTEE